MKKSVFSKLSFGFLSLITMLIACNTPISNVNSVDKSFNTKAVANPSVTVPLFGNASFYKSGADVTTTGHTSIRSRGINWFVWASTGAKVLYGEDITDNYSCNGTQYGLISYSNGILTFKSCYLSGTINIKDLNNPTPLNKVVYFRNHLPLPAIGNANFSLTPIPGSDQYEVSVQADYSYYLFLWGYYGSYVASEYQYDSNETMKATVKFNSTTTLTIDLSKDFMSPNDSSTISITSSSTTRPWSVSVDGTIYKDSPKSISFSNSQPGSYSVEAYYDDASSYKASKNIHILPVASPDPNATSNPNATSIPTPSPTVVPTPTPTPIPPPPPFCGTGTEMVGLKDMEGNPVCCPEGAICGTRFGGTNKKKPSGTPSGSPSTTPSTNPSSNPIITSSSNSTPNPTSSPDGGAGNGTKKKTGFLIIEDGKEIVSTVVDTKFSVLVTNLEDTDAWMLKLSGSDLVVASGIGSQIVDINSADLNRGLPSGSYLDDGYYDLYLDINPEAKTFIGIDNTPPEISVDETKSTVSTSGDVNLILKIEDPIVNGVSSGIDNRTLPKSILGSDGSNVLLAYTENTSNTNQDMQAYFQSGFGIASLKTTKKPINVMSKIHLNKKKGFKLKSVQDSLEEARISFILGVSKNDVKIADLAKNSDDCYVGKK